MEETTQKWKNLKLKSHYEIRKLRRQATNWEKYLQRTLERDDRFKILKSSQKSKWKMGKAQEKR